MIKIKPTSKRDPRDSEAKDKYYARAVATESVASCAIRCHQKDIHFYSLLRTFLEFQRILV